MYGIIGQPSLLRRRGEDRRRAKGDARAVVSSVALTSRSRSFLYGNLYSLYDRVRGIITIFTRGVRSPRNNIVARADHVPRGSRKLGEPFVVPFTFSLFDSFRVTMFRVKMEIFHGTSNFYKGTGVVDVYRT